MLLRHVNSFMQQLHFKGSHADVSMLGVWRAALAPESEWATLKPQILFRDYVRGGVLARMFGNKQVEGMLLQAARPIAKELYETLDDADVVLGFHLLSRLLLTNDTRLAMHVGRTACSMARALSNPAVQLGSEEYKLATSMLQYTLMRLQGAGVRFSLSELEYSLHSPDPPELDPSSAQSVNRRFQYEFFLTKVEMARCSSLTAVIISKLLPSADLLQAPRIDNAPADAATLRALHNRIEQLTLSIDLVYKHKVGHFFGSWNFSYFFDVQDELGLEGAWAYHNGLLHRLFVWCLLDRNDMAMNDLRHLALFFTYNESVFGAVPNRTNIHFLKLYDLLLFPCRNGIVNVPFVLVADDVQRRGHVPDPARDLQVTAGFFRLLPLSRPYSRGRMERVRRAYRSRRLTRIARIPTAATAGGHRVARKPIGNPRASNPRVAHFRLAKRTALGRGFGSSVCASSRLN